MAGVPPIVFPTTTAAPPPVKPPIATTPPVPPKTTVPPVSTTTRTKKLSTTSTTALPTLTSDPANKDSAGSGMSGGAVAGLVIGTILLLVCSVIGGFMLLKKRRKRMMGRGQYTGYPDTSRSRDLKQDDEDDISESKTQGGSGRLWGLVTGVLSKTQNLTTSKGTKSTVVNPPPPVQQVQHSMSVISPVPPVPAPNWGTAASPTPPTLMSSMASPATPIVGPNYGVNSNGIGSNYPSPGNNINNNSNTLISQPLFLPPTPQDQQLTWKEQQQLQQQQLQQQQLQQQQPQQQQIQQQQIQQQVQHQQQTQHLQQQQAQYQQLQQQQQQQYHHQQQLQQQQLQHMPVQGYALSVQPPIIISQQQPQHHSYHQQQAPLQMQQAPRNTVPSVATPAAQPYYYQPGTGLVSVPVSIPPPEPYTPQPFQPVQAVTPAPSVPFAMNTAHYPTQPVSLLPPPPPPKQQQQQQIQQQQQVAYQPPPVTQATIATSAAAAAPRPSTPESGSIYLPGDSSRLLLSQGLYKIVPDAEDEEEAARAAAVSSSQTGPAPIISMDLNLGGDFLSSVLNYPNRQGPNNRNSNTFSSISQGTSSNPPTVANGVQVSGGPGAQGQTVRQQPGYHDRQAGHKDRPKNQPRFLVDKEEVITEERGQNGVNTSNGEPVIVGSDIVFEPLPSVKAARARDSLHGGLDSTGTSSSSLLNNNDTAKPNGGEKLKGAQGLARAPTIGAFLPTMGTEEYLERTDDKEEYSARLHGARDSATSPTPSTNVVHPTTRGELSKEAQGGIVDISSPIIPNTITPPSSDAVTMAAAVIPPRSSTPVSPPPLRLSTKPKFN